MKSIDLGRLSIPLDQYASQGNAVLGIRGSGKSYTATYIAERLLDAGVPIVAFDPIGIWRFLRVPAAKGGEGYKVVVAGGEHGDIPLPANGAAEIMRAAMNDGVSIVFDLYDIQVSKAEWRRVVESALKVLLYENKAHGLRHVFLEEAAEFCPQRLPPGDSGTSAVYSMVERLARMGGNAQLGYTLVNQRAEEVNKAVLELCDLLILHRQKGRNSLTALGKWLDVAMAKGKVAEEVPALADGEAFIWPAGDAPPTKTKIPAKRTFHPDRKTRTAAVEAKSADVSGFVTTMRTSLERLTKEAEANDPKLLRAALARAEVELAKLRKSAGSSPAKDPAAIADAELRGHAQGYEVGYASALAAVKPIADRLETLAGAVNDTIHGFREDLQRLVVKAPASASIVRQPAYREEQAAKNRAAAGAVEVIARAAAIKRRTNDIQSGATGLAAAQRKILNALAFLERVGISPADKTQASLFAGLSPTAGHTQNMYGGLRSAGHLEYPTPGMVSLTASGRMLSEPGTAPQTADEMQRLLMHKLAAAQQKILRVLIEAYPEALDKRDASGRAGLSPDAGHTQNMYGGLRSLGLIDYPSPGRVVALPVLFLNG